MRDYETVIILKPNSTEEKREEALNTFVEFLKSKGKVTKIDKLGIKKLAYEINKNNEGYYVVIEFRTDSSNIAELQRLYRISDEVLKFIVMRKVY